MKKQILLIGDVCTEQYHTGDEAMFFVAIQELSQRKKFIVKALTHNPELMNKRYKIESYLSPSFSPETGKDGANKREEQLADILSNDPQSTSLSIIKAVEESDGVLICGGGNMTSEWPHLLYERIATVLLAKRAHVPVAFVGQTIGPNMTDQEKIRCKQIFTYATYIGVRDTPSHNFVKELTSTAQIFLHADDCYSLTNTAHTLTLDDELFDTKLPTSYIGLCLHWIDEFETYETQQTLHNFLQKIHEVSNLPIILLPNTGPSTYPYSDTLVIQQLLHTYHPDFIYAPKRALSFYELAKLTKSAKAIVSTRFHPIVFGLAYEKPVLALSQNQYCSNKLSGALAHAGMNFWQLPLNSLTTKLPEDYLQKLLKKEQEIASLLKKSNESILQQHVNRWDTIAALLDGDKTNFPTDVAPFTDHFEDPPPISPSIFHSLLGIEYSEKEKLIARCKTSEEYSKSLEESREGSYEQTRLAMSELEKYEKIIAGKQAEIYRLQQDVLALRKAVKAANEFVIDDWYNNRLTEKYQYEIQQMQYNHALEIEQINQTKLMRWSKFPRQWYTKIKSICK